MYNLTPETIVPEADVPFDTNGTLTAAFAHIPGSTDMLIALAGTYRVSFSLTGIEPNQFALFVNGSLIPGTVYGSGAGTQETNGQAIVTLAAGDVLTLRNHTSASAVDLQTVAGGTEANVNASILIERLN